jgi:4'-phosphopantetheinyl transferase
MAPFWETPPSRLLITKKDAHIWRASLDSPVIAIQKLNEILSNDEKCRADRFRFEKDKKRFIVRRGILRTILWLYLGVEPWQLQFCYGKNGKPLVADGSNKGGIHFNLSHSEGVAIYAFTQDREIGVDIEHIHDVPDMEEIAKNFFSKRENKFFLALPKRKKREAFFNCWTRKEAFIKTLGDGLSYPLDNFDVSLVPGEPAMLLRIDGDSKAATRWSIQDLKPMSGFAAAFASENRGYQIRFMQFSDPSQWGLPPINKIPCNGV